MVSLYELKPRFQRILRPLVAWLAGAGVSANTVTLAAAALSLAHGAWLLLAAHGGQHTPVWPLLLLPLTLFVRMALNAIDGMLAREHGQRSRAGAVLNELGDIVSDAALYLPFAALAPLFAPLVILVVVLTLISEATGILAQALTGKRNYAGPMGKSDRALGFGFIALWLGAGLPYGASVAGIAIGAIAVLALITIVNRARAAAGAPCAGEPT